MVLIAAASTLPWMNRTYADSERSNPYVPNSDSDRFRAMTVTATSIVATPTTCDPCWASVLIARCFSCSPLEALIRGVSSAVAGLMRDQYLRADRDLCELLDLREHAVEAASIKRPEIPFAPAQAF